MSLVNFNQQEIANFETQASNWWDIQGPFKTLHAINPLRLQFMTQFVAFRDKLILDVGCGGGILSEGMAKQGGQVTGIDLAAKTLAIAGEHAKLQNLNIVYETITVEEKAKNTPQSFDIVTCMEMLEHVPDPLSVIHACATLVKPEGHLFFSTLNRNLKSYLQAILGAEYLLKLIPKGVHTYEKFIKPSELAHWLRSAHLDLKQMAGIGYNPLTQQYYLNHTIDVNYLVYCQPQDEQTTSGLHAE